MARRGRDHCLGSAPAFSRARVREIPHQYGHRRDDREHELKFHPEYDLEPPPYVAEGIAFRQRIRCLHPPGNARGRCGNRIAPNRSPPPMHCRVTSGSLA